MDVLQSERDQLVERLTCPRRVRRITSEPELHGGRWISADVEPAAADDVLSALHTFDLHHDDFVLVREDILTQGLPPGGLSASGGYPGSRFFGEARANARPVARYFHNIAHGGGRLDRRGSA